MHEDARSGGDDLCARPVNIAEASAWAWGAFVFYAAACICAGLIPVAAHVTASVIFGMGARQWGWPLLAGCAGGVLAAPCFVLAWEQDGPLVASLSYLAVSGLLATSVLMTDEQDGLARPLTRREAALLLWLATSLAGVGGLLVADAVAWLVR